MIPEGGPARLVVGHAGAVLLGKPESMPPELCYLVVGHACAVLLGINWSIATELWINTTV